LITLKGKQNPMINRKTIDQLRGCLLGLAIGHNFSTVRTKGKIINIVEQNLAICKGLLEASKTKINPLDCIKSALTKNDMAQILPVDQIQPQVTNAGALARSVPIAIFSFLSEMNIQETASFAYLAARFTHNTPISTYPTVSLTMLLNFSIFFPEDELISLSGSGLLCGQAVIDDPASEISKYGSVGGYENLHRENLDNITNGSGLWVLRNVIENCLGFPALPSLFLDRGVIRRWDNCPSFETGIQNAIEKSLGCPYSASVTGSILGAYWGESGIPEKFKELCNESVCILDTINKMIEKYVSQKDNDWLKEIDDLPVQDGLIYNDKLFLKISLKSEYEALNNLEPDTGWHLINKDQVNLIRRGDLIRSFMRPYRAQNEILMREYRARSGVYNFVNTYYRTMGWRFARIDLYGNKHVQIADVFRDSEVWIKREE
jgi:hypothetical protein